MHFAVVSTHLGVAGAEVAGSCSEAPPDGDNGVLNPIRYGAAFAARRTSFSGYPTWYLPEGVQCSMPNELPAFLSFDSNAAPGSELVCMSAVGTLGCRLAQPLEAVTRALIEHDASDSRGNTDPNAGFLRPHSILAILVISAEDDVSVRNCAHSLGRECSDATDAYNPASTAWASDNIWLRFQAYRPGSAQDPMWPIERYVDPREPTAGWLGLRPSHPEWVVFGAITGVPLRGWQAADGSTAWDQLLGAPGVDREDYEARDPTSAIRGDSPEGPISMLPTIDTDPNCNQNLVPACYMEGSTYDATSYCTGLSHGARADYGAPSRRIIETARRFDESPLCHGRPCRNGVIESSCRVDLNGFLGRYAQIIRTRLAGL